MLIDSLRSIYPTKKATNRIASTNRVAGMPMAYVGPGKKSNKTLGSVTNGYKSQRQRNDQYFDDIYSRI